MNDSKYAEIPKIAGNKDGRRQKIDDPVTESWRDDLRVDILVCSLRFKYQRH